MEPRNLLVIMSDEHSIKQTGCYGPTLTATPRIDGLAARGTRFASAYCTVPICVPARAAFAVGKYNHQVGFWDNADPYHGSPPSWHHVLRSAGHTVVSIGKLHFRSSEDDNGFTDEVIPMHVIEGKGDLMTLVRDDLPIRKGAWKIAGLAGPGESIYTTYDRDIAARARIWLHEEAPRHADRPWVLFVSFVSPHFPLTAPPEHFYRYYDDPALPWPKQYAEDERPRHPYLLEYARSCCYDDYFRDEESVRRALAGYHGLCSFVDEQVGKVLDALEESGLAGSTRILYTSDHGDNLGSRGLWGKSTMYEESAAVPLVVAGEGIPAGRVVSEHASHVDVYPFVLEATGVSRPGSVADDHPGVSLAALAGGARPERTVLSEYHAMGSTGAFYMVRLGRYKYVHYVKYPDQLFDLEADPEELVDLGADPAYAEVRAEGLARLREMLDPAEVDARAKRRQAEQLRRNEGREAVIARGDLGFSVPPGVAPMFD